MKIFSPIEVVIVVAVGSHCPQSSTARAQKGSVVVVSFTCTTGTGRLCSTRSIECVLNTQWRQGLGIYGSLRPTAEGFVSPETQLCVRREDQARVLFPSHPFPVSGLDGWRVWTWRHESKRIQ